MRIIPISRAAFDSRVRPDASRVSWGRHGPDGEVWVWGNVGQIRYRNQPTDYFEIVKVA